MDLHTIRCWTARLHTYRSCPGQSLAEDNLFIVMVTVLAVFDIMKAVDSTGKPVAVLVCKLITYQITNEIGIPCIHIHSVMIMQHKWSFWMPTHSEYWEHTIYSEISKGMVHNLCVVYLYRIVNLNHVRIATKLSAQTGRSKLLPNLEPIQAARIVA